MVTSGSRLPHARVHASVEATRTRSERRKGRSTFNQNADLLPETFSGEYNSIFEKFLTSKLERITGIPKFSRNFSTISIDFAARTFAF